MFEIIFLILGLVIGLVVDRLWVGMTQNNKHSPEIEKLRQSLDTEKEARIKAQAQLSAMQTGNEFIQKHLHDSMQATAAQAMKTNNETFIQMAKQVMEQYIDRTGNETIKHRHALENLINPLKTAFENQEKLINNLETNSSKTFGGVKSYLEELQKTQHSLEKETNALVTALKAPKVRGRWGEIGLRRLVEFSGLSAYCDFVEQVNVRNDDGSLRPDMIVNLPDKKKIVIDSKVPLNAYLELCETDNELLQNQLIEKHSRAVLSHLRALSAKAYWSQFDETVDFVVMYIEVEPAFSMALHHNHELIADALKNRIILATPSTLVALLQTIAYSWRQHQATENALRIWQTTKEFYQRLIVFTEHLEKLGTNLQNSVKTYNQAIGSWEARIKPCYQKLEELGILDDKKQMPEISKIDITCRNKDL